MKNYDVVLCKHINGLIFSEIDVIYHEKIKIAIFGSTYHISKRLINNFLKEEGLSLHLYTKPSDKVRSFFDAIEKDSGKTVIYEGFNIIY